MPYMNTPGDMVKPESPEIEIDPHDCFATVMRTRFPQYKKTGPIYDLLVNNEFGPNMVNQYYDNWLDEQYRLMDEQPGIEEESFLDYLQKLIQDEIDSLMQNPDALAHIWNHKPAGTQKLMADLALA